MIGYFAHINAGRVVLNALKKCKKIFRNKRVINFSGTFGLFCSIVNCVVNLKSLNSINQPIKTSQSRPEAIPKRLNTHQTKKRKYKRSSMSDT